MNVVKPTIPREVADAIEYLRTKFSYTNRVLADISFRKDDENEEEGEWMPQSLTLREYAEDNADTLLAALVNGYEIARTPEELAEEERQRKYEEIREMYRCNAQYVYGSRYYSHGRGVIDGITLTLDALGIKIEGVNA